MTKQHLNNEGILGRCSAKTPESCDFYGNEHFRSKAEGESYLMKKAEVDGDEHKFSSLPKKSTKNVTGSSSSPKAALGRIVANVAELDKVTDEMEKEVRENNSIKRQIYNTRHSVRMAKGILNQEISQPDVDYEIQTETLNLRAAEDRALTLRSQMDMLEKRRQKRNLDTHEENKLKELKLKLHDAKDTAKLCERQLGTLFSLSDQEGNDSQGVRRQAHNVIKSAKINLYSLERFLENSDRRRTELDKKASSIQDEISADEKILQNADNAAGKNDKLR